MTLISSQTERDCGHRPDMEVRWEGNHLWVLGDDGIFMLATS